jgi:transcriptional regulator NrdR family protein
MLCPKCNGKSEVVDSRPYQGTIRRKRNCPKCKYNYRTLEQLEPQEPPKPKPKPKPKKRVLKPRTKNNKVWEQLEAVRTLTDEELEEAIMTGQVRFDEDEL